MIKIALLIVFIMLIIRTKHQNPGQSTHTSHKHALSRFLAYEQTDKQKSQSQSTHSINDVDNLDARVELPAK
jgi:hypothetical protein